MQEGGGEEGVFSPVANREKTISRQLELFSAPQASSFI